MGFVDDSSDSDGGLVPPSKVRRLETPIRHPRSASDTDLQSKQAESNKVILKPELRVKSAQRAKSNQRTAKSAQTAKSKQRTRKEMNANSKKKPFKKIGLFFC